MTKREHYPYLDLLRYLAALCVAISHFQIFLLNGKDEIVGILAVEIFFVLSGFVLANQINLVIKENKVVFLRIFLYRRWIRTIPPYLVAIFLAAMLFGYGNIENLIRHLFYLQNFTSDNPLRNFFSVGWSLSVEEWFYIFFPVFLLLAIKLPFKKFKPQHYALAFIGFFILGRFLYGETDNWGADMRRSVVFRLDAVAYGYIAFVYKDYVSKKLLIAALIVGAPFLAYLIMGSEILSNSLFVQNLFFVYCAAFFGATITLASKFRINSNITVFIFDVLARVSYPIYLFHIIIIGILSLYKINIDIILYFVIINIIALLFHYGFEYNILKARPKYPV